MALLTDQKTVTTTAQLLVSNTRGSENNPIPVAIKNLSAESVYIGELGVTVADGFPIAENETVTLDLVSGDDIYGLTNANTADVRIIRTRS